MVSTVFAFCCSSAYLVLVPFGQQDPNTQYLPEPINQLAGFDKIVAFVNQDFGQTLWISNKDSFNIEKIIIIDQAVIGYLVDPPLERLP